MPRMPEAFRLHFEIQYVGKTIKASKRRITWKFAFAGDQDEHSVVLVHTINSGKKVVFLNGNQIHEDDKMSLSQWVYPFQLEGHLVSVVIEGTGTLSDKEGYDLQIDGRMWNDMRLTTLLDLRAAQMRRAGGEVPRETREAMSAWTRGGAVAGVAAEAPTKSWDEEGRGGSYDYRGAPGSSRGREGSAAVPVKSMSDFLGPAAAAGGASGSGGRPAASSGGGAGDFGFGDAASSGGGGSWDPFAGVGGGKGGAPAVPVRASRESLGARAAPAHHAAAAPEPAHAAGGLRPPPAAGRSHGGANASAGGGRSSFAAPAAPASLADDLAGLSFGGAAPAPVRAPAAAAAGAYDPFGSSGNGAGAAADPFGSAPSSPAAAPVDIFSQPPGPAAPFPAHALAGATAAGAGGAAKASPAASAGVLEGGLINLDNLTDTGAGKGAAAGAAGGSKAAPSLAQLKASTGIGGSGLASAPSKPVMANNAAGTTGLGLSPLDLYTPAMPSAGMGPGAGMGMGYGMGARPMGPAGYGGGFTGGYGGAPAPGGGFPGGYGGAPAPGGGFTGGFGGAPAAPNPFGSFGAPAPAPAPRSADYNPFE